MRVDCMWVFFGLILDLLHNFNSFTYWILASFGGIAGVDIYLEFQIRRLSHGDKILAVNPTRTDWDVCAGLTPPSTGWVTLI